MSLRQLLKERRVELGLTQRDVADAVGCQAQYISDVECGRRGTIGDVERLVAWAHYLKLTIKDLMDACRET